MQKALSLADYSKARSLGCGFAGPKARYGRDDLPWSVGRVEKKTQRKSKYIDSGMHHEHVSIRVSCYIYMHTVAIYELFSRITCFIHTR